MFSKSSVVIWEYRSCRCWLNLSGVTAGVEADFSISKLPRLTSSLPSPKTSASAGILAREGVEDADIRDMPSSTVEDDFRLDETPLAKSPVEFPFEYKSDDSATDSSALLTRRVIAALQRHVTARCI